MQVTIFYLQSLQRNEPGRCGKGGRGSDCGGEGRSANPVSRQFGFSKNTKFNV